MKAMILAAGYGTRLRPYTSHTPKPLFPIAGRPLLDIIIQRLEKAGCRAVIINTHHLHGLIEDFLAQQQYGLEIYTRYEPEILGTGGAIKNVSDFWDHQPFMVVNADIIADFDLAGIYQAHDRHQPAATLALCDDPRFNSVAVGPQKWINEFVPRSHGQDQPADGLLTFTGVQVLEPLVLDYIPAGKPYSSIDAFKQILAEGKKLRSVIVPEGSWRDLGTPSSYRRTAMDRAIPLAFKEAFPSAGSAPVCRTKLKGDGSQRQWYRLSTGRDSLIMVDHGIRETSSTAEVDSFVKLGGHLHRQGVPVPQIYYGDTFSGLIFLEDLGDDHLQQAVNSTEDPAAKTALYREVIDQLIRMSRRGAENFDPAWTYQTRLYDRELMLEKECRYFQKAFLTDYLGYGIRYSDLEPEFNLLADKALQNPTIGFMHRDMQSRNIMLRYNSIYFIDFQGGRIGPLQYDLASLLIDPYVELPQAIQAELLDYTIDALSAADTVDTAQFRSCYAYCSLARNLQILGAFAFLSKVRGKKYFEDYIPAALQTLRANLHANGRNDFPGLAAAVEKAYCQMHPG